MSQGSEFVKHHSDKPPYREGLPPIPDRMKVLRVDANGDPVAWSVLWTGNKPDYTQLRAGAIATAYQKKLCFFCGQTTGTHLAFPIMAPSFITRIVANPPGHLECAQFVLKAYPPDVSLLGGVVAIYVTHTYRPFRQGENYAFELGSPWAEEEPGKYQVEWWRSGFPAPRKACWESLRTAMEQLIGLAQKDGQFAVERLAKQYQAALSLLPPGEPVPGLDIDIDPNPAAPRFSP